MRSLYKKCRPHMLPLALLVVVAFTVYGRVVGHDFLGNWDDNRYVVENADIQGFGWDRLKAVFSKYYVGNYAPVQMLSYMFDYAVWGLHPAGFYLSNLLLHLLNVLLLYYLLFRLVPNRLAAWSGAALFLLHPVQVETVAWISQRKNLLAMLFFLVAWNSYLIYRDNDARRYLYYAASMVAFLLALLSKSVAVIFPVAMLLFDYCHNDGNSRPKLLDKVPFLVLAAVAAVLAMISQTPDYQEWGAGGGRAGYHGGSPLATFLTMLPVICSYLRLLVWPSDLSALYDPAIHKSIDFTVLAAFIFLLGIGYLIYLLYRYDRRLAFWPLYFILALLPVSQIVPLVTLINDRYLYFPLVGAAALLAYGVQKAGEYCRHPVAIAVMVGMLGVFAIASYQRLDVWRNGITLWNDAVRKSPKLPLVWEALGEANQYTAKPNRPEAEKAYLQAIKLSPKSEISRYNLGVLYTEENDIAKADKILRELLQISPKNVLGWTAFGDLALHQFEYTEAESRYRQALSLQPEAIPIHRRIGLLMLDLGRIDEARRSFLQIESLDGGYDPGNAYELARVEAVAGDTGGAIRWLEAALQRGYNDFAGIMNDDYLTPVRPDGRFAELVRVYFPNSRP